MLFLRGLNEVLPREGWFVDCGIGARRFGLLECFGLVKEWKFLRGKHGIDERNQSQSQSQDDTKLRLDSYFKNRATIAKVAQDGITNLLLSMKI